MTGRAFARSFFFLAALGLAACRAPAPDASSATGNVQSYQGHGVIERISADHHLVTIHHQAIPGYMMEMTMDFPVRDDHLLDGMTVGDQIDFTLKVSGDDAWIGALQRTGHVNVVPIPADTAGPPQLKPRDPIPDAELVGDDGRSYHLSDFRGKAVAFTFFFTRCPLPTYCPLMNRDFAQARALLLAKPGAPKNWQFLSISFDPAFDTPQVLASYALFYRNHNPDRWLFASASPQALGQLAAPLGLIVMRQASSISHNLRTVVMDPNGRLYRQFNDNTWTPQELAQTVIDAAKVPPSSQNP